MTCFDEQGQNMSWMKAPPTTQRFHKTRKLRITIRNKHNVRGYYAVCFVAKNDSFSHGKTNGARTPDFVYTDLTSAFPNEQALKCPLLAAAVIGFHLSLVYVYDSIKLHLSIAQGFRKRSNLSV